MQHQEGDVVGALPVRAGLPEQVVDEQVEVRFVGLGEMVRQVGDGVVEVGPGVSVRPSV
ncbi:hypothetical protein OG873_22190 [Streptomyces violaceus]|uniref:Uncharacterized protein n=1 Tax=Streptomyces violaceus TaxID=1936 RepID=A0ABZ1NW24_STRVL